eukprot:10311819-Alexandrium_andersonii.AAC.1
MALEEMGKSIGGGPTGYGFAQPLSPLPPRPLPFLPLPLPLPLGPLPLPLPFRGLPSELL